MAKTKVFNQDGSNYVSYLEGVVNPSYGPGLVSISGQGSSFAKLIAAGDASSAVGDVIGVKTCATMYC